MFDNRTNVSKDEPLIFENCRLLYDEWRSLLFTIIHLSCIHSSMLYTRTIQEQQQQQQRRPEHTTTKTGNPSHRPTTWLCLSNNIENEWLWSHSTLQYRFLSLAVYCRFLSHIYSQPVQLHRIRLFPGCVVSRAFCPETYSVVDVYINIISIYCRLSCIAVQAE